jgi:hypothetical protein
MGGNSRKKRVNRSFLDIIGRIGDPILNLISGGYISRLKERERMLASRVIDLNVAYKKEKVKLAKQVGRAEASRDKLEFELNEANNEIEGLKGELADTRSSIEFYWTNAHTQFQEALVGLRNFHLKAGMEVDEETLVKSVGATMQRLGIAIKDARMIIRGLEGIVEKGERENLIGRYMNELEKDKVLIYVDGEQRIVSATEPAREILGDTIVGRKVEAIASRLGPMMTRVIPTYETGFYFDDILIDGKMLEVNMERTRSREYIGAILILIPKKKQGLLYRMRRNYNEMLTDLVSNALALPPGEQKVGLRLSSVSDDVAERIYGLSLSGYFRNKIQIVADSQEVYDALMSKNVPESMVFKNYMEGKAAKPAPEEGLSGELAPEIT